MPLLRLPNLRRAIRLLPAIGVLVAAPLAGQTELAHVEQVKLLARMEHASRLPRTCGFDFDDATPVLSVEVAADLPQEERLRLQRVDNNGPAFLDMLARRSEGSPDRHVTTPLTCELCELVSGAGIVAEEGS